MVPENDRLWTVFESLAYVKPDMPLSEALNAARDIMGRVDGETDPLLAAINGSKKIRDHIFLGQKIQAIKELRMITSAGLKDSKEAVERWQSKHA